MWQVGPSGDGGALAIQESDLATTHATCQGREREDERVAQPAVEPDADVKHPRHAGTVPSDGELAPDPTTGDPAERLNGDRGLARAFARLSENDREAIRLVAWEGLSNADAARAAGCSGPAFAVRLSRARGRLSRALDETPPVATFIVPERI